ncbi:MAG: hypothetical protein OEQ18_13330 [Gammaproteobacteria bacterium]|nr:hypothetical protein [Gammaproteobacteria bacterium]
MTVIVLNERIDAVVIGIKTTSVLSFFPQISIRLVTLDFDAVGVEAEDAVAGIVSAAVGQCIVFVDGVLADPSNDVIAPGLVYMIASHIDVGPQIMRNRFVLVEFDAAAGRVVANPYAADPDNSVVREAKVMEYRRFTVLHVDMDPSSLFAGHQAIDIMDVAIVDINVPVDPFHTSHKDMDAEQITLVLVRSVGIGYFQTVDFPVGQVLQEQASGVLSAGVNSGTTSVPAGINSDRSKFSAAARRREHPVEPLASLEQNDISGKKSGITKSVELFL